MSGLDFTALTALDGETIANLAVLGIELKEAIAKSTTFRTKLIQKLYEDLLGVELSDDDSRITDLITGGIGKDLIGFKNYVLDTILQSEEYRTKAINTVFHLILGRPAEDDELQVWLAKEDPTGKKLTGKELRMELIDKLMFSDEYETQRNQNGFYVRPDGPITAEMIRGWLDRMRATGKNCYVYDKDGNLIAAITLSETEVERPKPLEAAAGLINSAQDLLFTAQLLDLTNGDIATIIADTRVNQVTSIHIDDARGLTTYCMNRTFTWGEDGNVIAMTETVYSVKADDFGNYSFTNAHYNYDIIDGKYVMQS